MTRRWYALTPMDVLLFGEGNLIEGYVDNPALAQELRIKAERSYQKNKNVSFDEFLYPFISISAEDSLAIVSNQEPIKATPISNVAQAISFITPRGGQRVQTDAFALHFYNSIVAIDLTYVTNKETSGERIIAAFSSGKLLGVKDKSKLEDPFVRSKLPGVMLFLQTNEAVENKAFQKYLRSGVLPEISHEILWKQVHIQKLASTSSLELEHIRDFESKKFADSYDHKQSVAVDEQLEVLQIIYDAMLGAEKAAQNAAAEHLISFNNQMREKFGIVPKIDEEPYLETELKRFELQLLETLERFLNMVERRLFVKYSDISEVSGAYFIKAAFDEKYPIIPQVKERVLLETSRMKGRLKQSLDRSRQKNVGINKYIWRSRDDATVRPSHAANDDKIFDWGDPPATGHPGEEYGCRCYAEPTLREINDPPIEAVYPELILYPIGRSVNSIVNILRRVGSRVPDEEPLPEEEVQSPTEPVKKPVDDDIFKRPKDVPDDWVKKPARKKGGVKYIDPKSTHNDLRIQKGKPDSDFPSQRQDYVRWKKNGQWLDKNGKPSLNPEETHIPLKGFNFNKELFK